MNAAAIALGMQAEVLLLDKNIARLRAADADYRGHLQTVASNAYEIEKAVLDADLVIGAVLVPGAKAPTLVSNELVVADEAGQRAGRHLDRPGRLLRGLAPDHPRRPGLQGARQRSSTAWPTCPARCRTPRTYALTNVTLPYAVELANHGWREALRKDRALALGLNTHDGHVTYGPVAEAHGMPTSLTARRGPATSADAVAVERDRRGGRGPTSTTWPSSGAGRQHRRRVPPRSRPLRRRTWRGRRSPTLADGDRARHRRRTCAGCARATPSIRPGRLVAARAVSAVRGLHRFAVREGLVARRPEPRGAPAGPPRRLPKALARGRGAPAARGGRRRRRAARAARRARCWSSCTAPARASPRRSAAPSTTSTWPRRAACCCGARAAGPGWCRSAGTPGPRSRRTWYGPGPRCWPAARRPAGRHAAVPQRPRRPADPAGRVADPARGGRAGPGCDGDASRRTRCATRSPPTCSTAAPTCGWCRNCSATHRSPRPRSTRW